MSPADFRLFDVSRFPVVSIRGSRLPPGYGPQWVLEMDALLARGEIFAFIFLDSVENPTHDDQKLQTRWLKQNKQSLALLCRGAVSIEPDPAKRILKRAQGAVISLAFGLKFRVARDCEGAERIAREFLAGRASPDGDE